MSFEINVAYVSKLLNTCISCYEDLLPKHLCAVPKTSKTKFRFARQCHACFVHQCIKRGVLGVVAEWECFYQCRASV